MVNLSEATPDQIANYWVKQLAREVKLHEDWRKKAERTERIYWDEFDRPVTYPILNTVVRIKHTALYSDHPEVLVRRRNVDQRGPTSVGLAVERVIRCQTDKNPMEPCMHRVIDDFLITGLGHSRVRYKAQVATTMDPMTGMPIQEITGQDMWLEHVPWCHFRWDAQHDWDDVKWVAFDTYMTSKQIAQEFGIEDAAGGAGESTTGTHEAAGRHGSESTTGRTDSKDTRGKVCVSEIWHKPSRTIFVIAKGYEEPLDVREDVLNLKGFFPCPVPMFANVRSRRLMPWPDYEFYRIGAETCNRLQARKLGLQKQLKDTGFYDAQLSELDQLENAKDGQHVPIANLVERLAGAGVNDPANMLVKLPIQNTAAVLQKIDEQLEIEEQRIFRLTGINDLVLGSTEQYETAEAQRIKANWARIRLADAFDCLIHHLLGVYEIMAEIVVEHFELPRVVQMTGVQIDPNEWAAVQQDHMRDYLIDIEHELSVAQDQTENKVARNEAVQAITQFSTAAAPLVQQGAWTADFVVATLGFIARGFTEGRHLTDAIQALPGTAQQVQGLQQQIAQGQQQAQQMQAEIGQLRFRLSKFEEGEYYKDLAEAEKKKAEADKIAIEAAQLAAETQTMPEAALDEALTMDAYDELTNIANPPMGAPLQ